MTRQELIGALNTLVEAPDGIGCLRELVLQLAVRGLLVPQNSDDEPASVLLKQIAAEQRMTPLPKGTRKTKAIPAATADDLEFELPAGWEPVRLGSVAVFQYGKGLSEKDRVEEGPVPVYGSNGIVGRHNAAIVVGPTIIIGRKGSAGALNLCTVDCWPTDVTYFVKTPSGVSIDYWLLTLEDAKLPELAGGIKPGLNRNEAHVLLAGLPPTAEQHRIVARVDELMDLLDRLEAARNTREGTRAALRDAALAALQDADTPEEVEIAWERIAERIDDLITDPADIEPLRQTVLQLAVRGRLVPQDPNDEPAIVLLDRIAEEKVRLVEERRIRKRRIPETILREEEPFELPVAWEWARLGDLLLDIEAGWSPTALKRPKQGDEWGVLKVSACSWGRFLPEENKALHKGTEPRFECEVQPHDFLISRANTKELVARSVVVEDDCPKRLMLSDKTLRLRIGTGVSVRYANLANLSESARAHYRAEASGTSDSMRNVTQDSIWSAPIPVPPASEQCRIIAKVDELMSLLDRLEERLVSMTAAHHAFAAAAVHHLDA